MPEKFDPSPIEIAEHERAALEVTRLRRKGVQCHLEAHAKGIQTEVDVIRDPDWQTLSHEESEIPSAVQGKGA
ncbi:hypothetical protein [Haloferula sp.]|uniref:hypothetical protein n=1 Tax=Haloferula sp. TaxID=2497595 RepID=UPI003C73EB5B